MYPRSIARIVPGSNRSVRATLISLVLPSVTTANDGKYPSWSSSRCSLIAPFVVRYFAQSNMLTDRSMMLPSRLSSLFLKRNFFRPPWLCTSPWHLNSVCSNTDSYNCHGRCSLAYASVDLFGATGTPRCFSCPSQQASPPQISRNEWARPNWQNSIAMNCPQLVKPRACRSALCSFTDFSNSPRENSFNTCEKMLHTFIRLSLLWLSWSFRNPIPPYQELSLSPADALRFGQQLAR